MPSWWEGLLDDQAPRIIEGHVTVRIGRYGQYALVLTPVGEEYRSPDKIMMVRVEIVNTHTDKTRLSLHLHPWWLRVFVFDLAQAVATIEREFETLPAEYVQKMENAEQEKNA